MGTSGLAEISTDGSAGEIQKGLSNAQAKCLTSFRQKSARLLCLHRELIRQCKDNNNFINNKEIMKFRFDFHPELTFHGWKDYNYCHILPRVTLFTAPRWRSNWDDKLIGQHFDFTIGWLMFEISIGMECFWKEPAKPKFNVGDHICCSDCSHAVVEAVNFDKGNDGHWTYQCLDIDKNSEDYDKYFYINAEIEHLWDLK